jgi:hypothetical protein
MVRMPTNLSRTSAAGLMIVCLASSAAFLAGCQSKTDGAARPGPGPGETPARDAAQTQGTGAGQNRIAKKPTLLPRQAVKELVDRWLDAQNQGDFAAYSALYGDAFQGVRRSGKKTVRLDRSGWLADRQRMFRRPMTVAISNLEIAVGPSQARVGFVQDWASGKYHDVGPKAVVVASTPAGLRIVGEEMLSSILVAAAANLPLASAQLALVHDGKLLLADAVAPGWAAGAPTLVSGHLVEQDPGCQADPPDYEAEQGRYWECHNDDPKNAYSRFVASRPITPAALPAALAAWTGKRVALYGAAGKLCEATAGELLAWGEWESTIAGLAVPELTEEAASQAVLDKRAVVLGALAGACKGAVFARAAELPAPPQWTLRAPEGPLLARLAQALAGLPGYADIKAPGIFDDTSLLELAPPDAAGRRFAVASIRGALNCHEDGFVLGVWEVTGAGDALALTQVFEASDRRFDAMAAADVTGDGVPEIVVSGGLLIWQDGAFARFRPLDFPEEVLDACHCECE